MLEVSLRLKAARFMAGALADDGKRVVPLTVEKLAAHPILVENGITVNRIQEIEQMKTKAPARAMELEKIAEALRVPDDWLKGDAPFEVRRASLGHPEPAVEDQLAGINESLAAIVTRLDALDDLRALAERVQANTDAIDAVRSQRVVDVADLAKEMEQYVARWGGFQGKRPSLSRRVEDQTAEPRAASQ